jgi:hypothetical protein
MYFPWHRDHSHRYSSHGKGPPVAAYLRLARNRNSFVDCMSGIEIAVGALVIIFVVVCSYGLWTMEA